MPEEPLAEAVAVLRTQRHSFLNHLQVIFGWLQLERPERARQYLESLNDRLVAEADVIRQVNPALGLLVIVFGLEAETCGVRVTWHLTAPLPKPSERVVSLWRSVALSALRTAPTSADGSRLLTIALGPGDVFHVHTPPPGGEG